MSYSLSNAAAACGVYKSTVLRSIKAGRLTATKDGLGQWRIEPAELHRVYPPAQRNSEESNAVRHGAAEALRAALAEERVADLKATLDDVRSQRDKWQQQAERLALTDARARQLTPRELRWTLIISGCGLGVVLLYALIVYLVQH
jgi:excisionase family DNA binding protein